MCFTTIPIANVSAATDVPVAKNQYLVVPGGDTIGLHMDTGVYIAGKYQVETREGKVSPWRKSEVREGDKIIKINNVQVKTNQNLLDALASINSNTVDLVIKRGDMTFRTTFDVAISRSGDKSLGLYIKDKVVGVGTLTFIDHKTNRFAALGHGIFDNKVNDQDVGGNILSSNVESIKKAAPGIPGEKRAMLDKMTIGNITKNKITGIYGNITNRSYTSNRKLLPVAMKNDVKVGKAEILTVIEDDKVEAFDIEIVEVKKQTAKSVKGIKIKVIDRDLLNKTGGIIQGMSGSPIIQNNQLVGAVSHVIVDSPQYGYGIFVEWMLLDCGLSVNY